MKNIYDEFNNVDIDLSEYDDIALEDNDIKIIKERVSSKLVTKRKHNYKQIVAIFAGGVICSALLNNDTVSASIENLSRSLKSYFTQSINRDFTDYTTIIGSTVTDKNISITLDEVIIDSNQIMINYTTDFSKLTKNDKSVFKNKEDYINNVTPNINVNGETFRRGSTSIQETSKDVINYIAIYSFDNLDINKPLDINLEFEVNDLTPIEGKSGEYLRTPIEGDWNFNFNISENNINETVQKMTLTENNTIETLNGDILRINEVTKSDISFRVAYDVISDNEYSFSNWDMTVREETKEKLTQEIPLSHITDNSGYSQYFIKNKDNNKFILEIRGINTCIAIDFNNLINYYE